MRNDGGGGGDDGDGGVCVCLCMLKECDTDNFGGWRK